MSGRRNSFAGFGGRSETSRLIGLNYAQDPNFHQRRYEAARRFVEASRAHDLAYQYKRAEDSNLPAERPLPRVVREGWAMIAADPALASLAAPGSKISIDDLPKVALDESMLGEDGTAGCPICRESMSLGDEVVMLPCKHWFDSVCIGVWLKEAQSCPMCRSAVPTKPS